jgi:Protein of unknown function (DUF3305)
MPTLAMDVGVVVARRAAKSQWLDWMWEAHAVLPEPPAAEPGAPLGGTAEEALFYAGQAVLEAHTVETQFYRDNLSSGQPSIWVVLRPRAGDELPEIVKVTCDPTEGEGYSETGWDLVHRIPMPEPVEAALASFVAEHHVETAFVKRKRDRQDPEALAQGRRGPDRDRFLRERTAKEHGDDPA